MTKPERPLHAARTLDQAYEPTAADIAEMDEAHGGGLTEDDLARMAAEEGE